MAIYVSMVIRKSHGAKQVFKATRHFYFREAVARVSRVTMADARRFWKEATFRAMVSRPIRGLV